jgi:hypothetical protein
MLVGVRESDSTDGESALSSSCVSIDHCDY